MPTKLSQVIGLETGARDEYNRVHDAAKNVLLGGHDKLTGVVKTYEPFTDDAPREHRRPQERRKVQVNGVVVLDEVAARLARLLDVTFTKEEADTEARADVEVDGQVLVEDAPVIYLLALDRELLKLRHLLEQLPLLDSAQEWEPEGRGMWKTKGKVQQYTSRVRRVLQLAPATKEHAEQVESYIDDVPVGDATTVHFCGGFKPEQVRAAIARCRRVQDAVHVAIAEANTQPVTDREAGEVVTQYILSGILGNEHKAQAQRKK